MKHWRWRWWKEWIYSKMWCREYKLLERSWLIVHSDRLNGFVKLLQRVCTCVLPAWTFKWPITRPLRTFLYYDADPNDQTRNLKKKFCEVTYKKIPNTVRSFQSTNKSSFNTACLLKLTFYRLSSHIQRNEFV